jgi:branched-chain amino acid transport system substrate-binding protein
VLNRGKVKAFVKAIQASSGKLPGSFEALGYDSVTLLEEAIKKAGTSRTAIGKSLHELKDVEGVTGRITMGANGDAIRPLFIKKVVKQDNGYVARHVMTFDP